MRSTAPRRSVCTSAVADDRATGRTFRRNTGTERIMVMRITAPLLIGALLGLSLAAAHSQGLVANGDFSAGDTGWTVDDAHRALYEFTDADGHAAPGALRYGAAEEVPAGPVTQRFACPAGADLVLMAGIKTDGSIRHEIRVVDPADGRVIAGVQSRTVTEFTTLSAQFNTGAATELELRIFGSSEIPITQTAQIGWSVVDDVQVYPVALVPEEIRPRDLFTPPGPNIALGQPYEYSPRAQYPHCADQGDATQLTDGSYTVGYFWTQRSTVGWMRTQKAGITIDLGEDQPIAGVSFNTAGATAGVTWPNALFVLVGGDGETWHLAGDLVELSNQELGPPPTEYAVHRFATSKLRTHGRYVRLLGVYFPFLFCDEIEVYRGPEELLAVEPPGELLPDPAAFAEEAAVVAAIGRRLTDDLRDAREAIAGADLPDAQRAALMAEADRIAEEIGAMPAEVPEGFTTVLPLNDLHARIYALNAPVLRSQGYGGLSPWAQNRWDPLSPTQAPEEPPGRAPSLRVDMMLNEWRGEVFNLTNATDEPITALVSVHGLPGADNPEWVNVHEVLHTDTREMRPIAAALPEAAAVEGGYEVTIPAGVTRQVWLSFKPEPGDVKPGEYGGEVHVRADGVIPIEMMLEVCIFPFIFPDEPTLSLGGWDYTDAGGYGLTARNREAIIEALREHSVDTPWATRGVVPSGGQYDEQGNLTNDLEFARWDRWVGWWPDARYYNVFLHAAAEFEGEPLGTDRFDRMVGDWITAWVEHMAPQGIDPGQLQLLVYDEPNEPHESEIIVAYARAIKAARPEVRIWEDPRYKEPWNADQDVFRLSDVLCPNTYVFLRTDQRERDVYLQAQAQGSDLWFYDCSGPGKALDPYAYHRGQMWAAMRYGALGCGFWCFTSSGGGAGTTSWNAYAQTEIEYSPLFIGETTVTRGKHMEAIREGVQDYEYYVMLRDRVEELRADGIEAGALGRAEALLADGPGRVLDPIAETGVSWGGERDRSIMDRVRVEMLEALSELRDL